MIAIANGSHDTDFSIQNPSNSTSSQAMRVRIAFLLGVTTDEQQYQINYEHDVFGKTNAFNMSIVQVITKSFQVILFKRTS